MFTPFTRIYCQLLPSRAACALGRAVEEGAQRKVELLLDGGTSVALDSLGRKVAPLLIAVSWGRDNIVALLLAKGADVNAKDHEGKTPLHNSAGLSDKREGIAECLLAHGANVNAKSNDGTTPLHCAAIADSKRVAEMLVASGAEIEARSNGGSTPLHYAAAGGSRGVTELLLAKGARVNPRDNQDRTPLHSVASADSAHVAEMLLASGADVNLRDADGRTPLHDAAKGCTKPLIQCLLARGADIDATDNEHFTPLEVAAKEAGLLRVSGHWNKADWLRADGRVKVVELLLDEIDARYNKSQTHSRSVVSSQDAATRVLHYGLSREGLTYANKEQEIRLMEEALQITMPDAQMGLVVQVLSALRKRSGSSANAEATLNEVVAGIESQFRRASSLGE